MLYGNYCDIFIENFPRKFSPCDRCLVPGELPSLAARHFAFMQMRYNIGNNGCSHILKGGGGGELWREKSEKKGEKGRMGRGVEICKRLQPFTWNSELKFEILIVKL